MILSFAERSVNENALAVKGKVHCLAATLARQGSQMLHLIMAYYFYKHSSKQSMRFRLFAPCRKTKIQFKSSFEKCKQQ
jgi:hypothetical protein